MKLLVFGEILYDIIGSEAYFGGASANVCAHAAKLGSEAFMLSRVGEDAFGSSAINLLRSTGVHTGFITRDPGHPTGEVIVRLFDEGIPDYEILKERAYDYIQYTQEQIESIKAIKADCFYFGTLHQRNAVSKKTLQTLLQTVPRGCCFYDINLRKECYNKENIHRSMQAADILKINDEELITVCELFDIAQTGEDAVIKNFFNTYPFKIVIITKGKQGAVVHTHNHSRHIPGVPVKVADTVGAGDAFCAAFIKYYVQTKNPFIAAQAGNILGSYVAGKRGALPEYNDALIKDLRSILNQAIHPRL